jgi:hypothetical protein
MSQECRQRFTAMLLILDENITLCNAARTTVIICALSEMLIMQSAGTLGLRILWVCLHTCTYLLHTHIRSLKSSIGEVGSQAPNTLIYCTYDVITFCSSNSSSSSWGGRWVCLCKWASKCTHTHTYARTSCSSSSSSNWGRGHPFRSPSSYSIPLKSPWKGKGKDGWMCIVFVYVCVCLCVCVCV